MKDSFAIVAVGYNRPKCMQRLLTSLRNAEYYSNTVPLVISIDYSGNNEVLKCAENFDWPYGEKIIIEHKIRLGLKEHILSCGQLTSKYGNIAVFEDDLFVSSDFYAFARQTLEKYSSDDRIAGIGLYNQQLNQNSGLPFTAINDGFDVYFMQYPCSWGQIWTRQQWENFFEWYLRNSDSFSEADGVPQNVCKWNEKSWLKYHVKYCVDNNKYFVYPQVSITTNFSSIGTHSKTAENAFQVPLLMGKKDYKLPDFEESNSKYDVFFENEYIWKFVGVSKNEIDNDLNGSRKLDTRKRYLLSTRNFNYKVINTYGLELRPIELNIIYNIEGKVIKLYDTSSIEANNQISDRIIENEVIHYHVRSLSYRKLIRYSFKELISRLISKFLKMIKND